MRNSILLSAFVFAFVVSNASVPVAAEESFPYTAYVNSRDVYVRSGPGRDYYPTEKVQPGTKVEVYRRDPGGWLAIRPTSESFSWVSSRHVKSEPDGLGEVTDERVASRVGSLFSNVRDVTQVRLKRGEVVEIVDEQNTGGQTWYKISPPSGEFRWISGRYVQRDKPHDGVSKPRLRSYHKNEKERRIRTPLASDESIQSKRNGESNTNSETDLDTEKVAMAREAIQEGEADKESPLGEPSDRRHRVASADASESDEANSNESVRVAGYDSRSGVRRVSWDDYDEERDLDLEAQERGDEGEPNKQEPAIRIAPEEESNSDEDQSRDKSDSARASHWEEEREDYPVKRTAHRADRRRRSRASSQSVSREASPKKGVHPKEAAIELSAEQFQAKLDQLNSQLSQMVAEEPTAWSFAEASADLEAMFESAGTAIERGKVRRMLNKVARFQDIQSRYQNVNKVQSETDRHNGELQASLEAARKEEVIDKNAPRSGVQRVSSSRSAAADFDGLGTLRPVVSRRAGAPPYALVDERGDVRWFISPSPGMNLQSLLGRKIGVTGSRGYMPEYGRPHVMVRRAQRIDDSSTKTMRR